ncbi:hypothetical protein GGS20DRAFT_539548 [Poronia punctata]|nr:hypothetical protein GGS20DRAFT_539548 [Poronia punctata]
MYMNNDTTDSGKPCGYFIPLLYLCWLLPWSEPLGLEPIEWTGVCVGDRCFSRHQIYQLALDLVPIRIMGPPVEGVIYCFIFTIWHHQTVRYGRCR